MIGALAALILIGLGSRVVGQALACLAAGSSRERPAAVSWLAPAYGLAALLVVAGLAIRLPGHAVTAAVALSVIVLASAAYAFRRVEITREDLVAAAPVLAVTILAAGLPFAIAGHVGILGAGLVNDDMASHLIIADYIADPAGVVPSFVRGGYPTGPHALVAAIAEGTGAGLVEVFAGLSLALAALLGVAALGALQGLPRWPRVAGACLVALSYLGAAYLAQGAFKEPLLALLVLGFGLALADLVGLRREGVQASAAPTPRAERPESGAIRPQKGRSANGGPRTAGPHPLLRVLPLAVIAAGVVFSYSLPGLLWLGAVGVVVVAARVLLVRPRPKLPEGWGRRFAPYALGGLVVLAVATAGEWSRIGDFTRLEALNPDRFGSQLGNLRGSLSPLEVLGIWPAGDFRTAAEDASLPTIAFYLGATVGLLAFGAGLVRSLRGERPELAAIALAALAAWAFLAVVGSPYVAAKGLAVAAPLVIAVAAWGTLGSRGPMLALGVVLALGAAASSFLVLRQSPVGPLAHANSLDEIRDAVRDEDVLFLGRDDFIGWELRGSGEITGVVTNFYDVEDARPRFKKGEGGGEKFDVDVLFPRQLDRFRYVLATAGGPASQVPPRFVEAVRTRDYVLYERTGATGKRVTLDEGTQVGATLDCSRDPRIAERSGQAVIWEPPPVIGETGEWTPDDQPVDGSPSVQRLELPEAGEWLISLEYDSRRPLRVVSEELRLDETVPANLDFRGETPTFPVAEVSVDARTEAEVSVEPEKPNALARLLGAPNEAHLRSLTATPLDPEAIRRVPLADACGEYVDWYRPG